jgi:hypothetical protein
VTTVPAFVLGIKPLGPNTLPNPALFIFLQTIDVTDTPVKINLAFLDLVEDFVLAYKRSASSPSLSSGF